MKATYNGHARLSFIVLMMMIAGMVLAACGGNADPTATTAAQATATTGTAPGQTTAEPTTPQGDTATATTGTTGQASPTAPEGQGTLGPKPTPGGTEARTTATVPTQGGTQGNCGIGEAIAATEIPAEADPNGEMVYNLAVDPDNADPQAGSYSHEIEIMSQAFSPLLTLDKDQNVVANVAESCEVSQDGKTYTFKLRDTQYSDGKPVTAQDYAYGIIRSCDPEVNGQYSAIMYDIVGCQEYREAYGADPENPVKPDAAKLKQLREAVAVKATDDKTLQIKLKNPAGYFTYIMTLWTTMPSRQDLVEKGGSRWWASPETYVGNGPFKLVSYQPKQQMVWARNENFFRGKPGLARMTWKIVNSENTSILAYQRGQLDVNEISSESLPRVQGDPKLTAEFVRMPSPLSIWFSMNNCKNKPFNDKRVRQAIAAAVDRELYIKQVANGVGKPSGQLQPEAAPVGRVPQDQEQKFDLARAKQLLTEAGFPNGQRFPTVRFPYSSDDEVSKLRAEWWSQQLKQNLGITVQPVPTDPAEIVRLRKSQKCNEFPDFVRGGWYQDYPHPQNWSTLLFKKGSEFRPVGWTNEEFDSLVAKADSTVDIKEAEPLYRRLNEILVEDAPVVFTQVGEDLFLRKPYVKGVVSYPGDVPGLQRQSEKIYVTPKA